MWNIFSLYPQWIYHRKRKKSFNCFPSSWSPPPCLESEDLWHMYISFPGLQGQNGSVTSFQMKYMSPTQGIALLTHMEKKTRWWSLHPSVSPACFMWAGALLSEVFHSKKWKDDDFSHFFRLKPELILWHLVQNRKRKTKIQKDKISPTKIRSRSRSSRCKLFAEKGNFRKTSLSYFLILDLNTL